MFGIYEIGKYNVNFQNNARELWEFYEDNISILQTLFIKPNTANYKFKTFSETKSLMRFLLPTFILVPKGWSKKNLTD